MFVNLNAAHDESAYPQQRPQALAGLLFCRLAAGSAFCAAHAQHPFLSDSHCPAKGVSKRLANGILPTLSRKLSDLIQQALAFQEIKKRFLQQCPVILVDAGLADRYFRRIAAG